MAHITVKQRYTISMMLERGYKQIEIARVIGKDKSIISREIRRNCDQRNGSYHHDLAQRKYEERQKMKPKKVYFTEEVRCYVEGLLAQKYSPEQIAGIAKKEGIVCVSHERIYKHLWQDKKLKGNLYEHLRTQGKRYRKRGAAKDKRGIITGRIDITQRPAIVEQRQRLGDVEIDTIIGKNHKGAIITINDRVTGMLKMRKISSKDAKELAKSTIEALQEWKPYLRTITADNGKEFANHLTISKKLGIDFYFAKPYHSWERGSNENLNGLIRQYIPKKTDFTTITPSQIQFIETQLNNRPRKRFNFETPIQIFNQKGN